MSIRANVRSRGLGDTVAKVTRITGIDTAVKFVAKVVTGSEDCGCDNRQNILNRVFPYNEK